MSTPTNDNIAFEKINYFNGSHEGWGGEFYNEGLKLVSAASSPVSRAIFEYKVHAKHCNSMGNLHGGASATLFDYCTSMALVPVSREGFWNFVGVSRTLNVTYLRPMPTGTIVLIECEVIHAGKKLCTIKGTMKRKSDGAVMAICEHGKVNIDADLAKL